MFGCRTGEDDGSKSRSICDWPVTKLCAINCALEAARHEGRQLERLTSGTVVSHNTNALRLELECHGDIGRPVSADRIVASDAFHGADPAPRETSQERQRTGR